MFGRLEQRQWDTQEGEKRTKIEVVAEEIGPSLRWAQAQVERTARTTGDAAQGGSAPSGSFGGGGGGAAVGRPADPPYGEEEPF